MYKHKLVDFIIQFMEEVDKEISDLKLAVNSRARNCAAEFLKSFAWNYLYLLIFPYRSMRQLSVRSYFLRLCFARVIFDQFYLHSIFLTIVFILANTPKKYIYFYSNFTKNFPGSFLNYLTKQWISRCPGKM